MSLEDRLSAAREKIRDECEEPINLPRLSRTIYEFADLLLACNLYSKEVDWAIKTAQQAIMVPIRPGFNGQYEREFIKAAYYLAGLYDAMYNV